MSAKSDPVDHHIGSAPPAQDTSRSSHRGRDVRAGHDGQPGGPPTWHRAEPVLHLAAAGGAGGADGAASGEEAVPASDYRSLQSQVRELQRLLGKKTLEAEILKEALEHAAGSKKRLRLPLSRPKDGSR